MFHTRFLKILASFAALFLLTGCGGVTPGVVESLTIEAGDRYPWPDQFLTAECAGKVDAFYAYDVSGVDTRVPGTYPLQLKVGDEVLHSSLEIVDTVAPTGRAKDLVLVHPATAVPEDFIEEISDITAVTVTFARDPDFDLEGDQTVELLLTDAGGNETVLKSNLHIIFDSEAPVIRGVKDFLIYAGDTIAYRSGVTVTDNRDENPALSVDSSAVDLSTPGTYTVTYTATDYIGNSASLSATVTVREKLEGFVDLETIYAEADKYLALIVKDGMNTEEQVRAIATWVRNNNVFVGHSVKDDWLQGAYRMMTQRRGDCFNYYSMVKLLLERLGIPTIDVKKVPNFPGDSNHYWSLVSVDGGETYYHVDATPRNDPTNFILVTDAFMDNYSASHNNCFNRDKSLYPATPDTFTYTEAVG